MTLQNVVCNEFLKPKRDVIIVDESMSIVLDMWLQNRSINEGCMFKYEIHKQCFQKIQGETARDVSEVSTVQKRAENPSTSLIDFKIKQSDMVGENSSLEQEVGRTVEAQIINENPNIDCNTNENVDMKQSSNLIDRRSLIYDILKEHLLIHMEDEIPAHVPSVFISAEEAFEDYTLDLDNIDTINRHDLENALSRFLFEIPEYKVDMSSKKHGRLVYSTKWNLVVNLYVESKKK